MQTWVAIALLVGQGIFLLIGWKMVKRFGDYVDVLLTAHHQTLKIRENLAIQENDLATREILHTHRRHDDPPPFKEELA